MFHQYLYQTKENLFNKNKKKKLAIIFILLPGTDPSSRLDSDDDAVFDDIFECVSEFSRRLWLE